MQVFKMRKLIETLRRVDDKAFGKVIATTMDRMKTQGYRVRIEKIKPVEEGLTNLGNLDYIERHKSFDKISKPS